MIVISNPHHKIRTATDTIYVVPFFNMYFGCQVYLTNPIINEWGLNDKDEAGIQVCTETLFDFLGIQMDYKKLDYYYHTNKFKDKETEFTHGFQGGLMAEPMKLTANFPIDKHGKIIFKL